MISRMECRSRDRRMLTTDVPRMPVRCHVLLVWARGVGMAGKSGCLADRESPGARTDAGPVQLGTDTGPIPAPKV